MSLTKKIIWAFGISLLLLSGAHAESNLSLGVVLNASDWSGDNGPGQTSFDSDGGGQLGFSISYSKQRFYTGLSLQGGDYQFDNTGPKQFTSSGNVETQNVKVSHSDFDLLAGYYFWEKISLFVDLKAVSSKWQNNDYEQNFSGLGLGVSGYHPINNKWTLYGSWGFVGGKIEETKGNIELGDAVSNAFIFGANYTLSKNDRLNMGLKIRNYLFEYDDGSEQEYSLNGLFVGYNHVFTF